MSQRWIKF